MKDTLVTTDWLHRHLDDPDLVILDCTVLMDPDADEGLGTISGRATYDSGHIPGAEFADLAGELSNGDSPFQFALPTVEQFCSVMGALGVGDNSNVVLYDGSMTMWAARVWWMLRWVGFDRTAILDGGMKAWTAENRPLSTRPSTQPARVLNPSLRPDVIAHRDEVLAAIDNDAVSIVDTLMEEHYRGEMALYDRPGHIRGASNTCALDLFDESGRFLSHDALAAMHTGDRDARTITYCGAGIMASCNAFVMARLGFTNIAVYTASLQEWAANPTNPMLDGTP